MIKILYYTTTIFITLIVATQAFAKGKTEVKVKHSYTIQSSEPNFKSEAQKLEPLLKHLHSKKISGPITVIYELPYTTQDSTTISTLPSPPQLGTVRITEFCSGNSRVQLTQEFRYTADVNDDGNDKNDSDSQWVVTGFKELAQESDECKGIDL